jgi:glutamate-1-semialdehyde 2,1-aminomutase
MPMDPSRRKSHKRSRSEELFERSRELIPGGVNSPVRAFDAVGGRPFVAEKGQGAYVYDIDGNRYIDYVMSWGPLILGHAPKPVIEAVKSSAVSGLTFGTPTRDELTLVSMVRDRMPCIEKMRLVNSGTEACMTAARIARGATGRDIIVKFDGGYHGHSDFFLVAAGSGMATQGLPSSGGVPADATRTTISLPYNEVGALRKCFAEYGDKIAAVIVEPVAANMGVIEPDRDFLEALRTETRKNESILIFDEVITGFRVAPGGAAELYGMEPDLVCLGKILGGGLPIGAVGGRKELLDALAPIGKVYQAGTLSGNPLSTSAGIATLKELEKPKVYEHLKQYADDLTGKMSELFDKYGQDAQINRVESLFTPFFSSHKITDLESARRADMEIYAGFFRGLLKNGVFVPPSGFEAWFVSLSHKRERLDLTIGAMERSLADMS